LIAGLPIGLWLASLGADVMYRSGRAPASWDDAAFFTMFAGLVAAVLLLGPGVADELVAGTRPRLRQPGRLELQLAVAALFVVSLYLRAYALGSVVPVWLSFAGIALLVISAGLGRDAARARPCPREILIVTRRRRTARSA
jgi:uncharacterized membrane protein